MTNERHEAEKEKMRRNGKSMGGEREGAGLASGNEKQNKGGSVQ